MRNFCSACILFLLVLLSINQNHIHVRALSTLNGLRLRKDSNGNPRLASLVEILISSVTRFGLCARSVEQLSVQVDAKSNRAVLKGDLKKVSIRVKNSRGPFLHVSGIEIQGSDLHLGWRPLAYTTFPLAWLFLRPPPFFMLLCLIILFKKERIPISRDQSKNESLLSRFKNELGGSPCTLDYSISLHDDNVKKSKLLQIALRMILRSLMLNSVLGVAATTADTMTILSNAFDPNQLESERNPNKLLAGTTNDSGSSQQLQNEANQQSQPLYLTQLLEATSFELVNSNFSNGRILFDAQAIFPDNKQQTDNANAYSCNNDTSRSRLNFTLRTTPKPYYDEQRYAMAFTTPECRFSVGNAMGGVILKTLPDWNVWLPVGSGVVIPFGTHHRVRKVNVADGSCRVSGRVSLFGKENIGLGMRLQESIAQTAHLPFGISESPKALPFTSNDD